MSPAPELTKTRTFWLVSDHPAVAGPVIVETATYDGNGVHFDLVIDLYPAVDANGWSDKRTDGLEQDLVVVDDGARHGAGGDAELLARQGVVVGRVVAGLPRRGSSP